LDDASDQYRGINAHRLIGDVGPDQVKVGRMKIIPHALRERPALKLMYAAVIRAADRWRGLTVCEFEQRQLRAIREELDRAHAECTRPAVRHIPSASP